MANRDNDLYKRGLWMEAGLLGIGVLGASVLAGPEEERRKHLVKFVVIGTMMTLASMFSMQQTRTDILRSIQQPALPPPVPLVPETAPETVPLAGWY